MRGNILSSQAVTAQIQCCMARKSPRIIQVRNKTMKEQKQQPMTLKVFKLEALFQHIMEMDVNLCKTQMPTSVIVTATQ